MSADKLREAAKVLRERAEAATPGPWVQNGNNGIHTRVGACVATTAQHNDGRRKADAVYLHTMHPGVGLALADWLDDDFMHQHGPTEHAIALADLILGGAS